MIHKTRIQHTYKKNITVDNLAATYSTGDALGTKQSFEAHELPGRGVYIQRIAALDSSSNTTPFKIHFFSEDFTGTADNAAMSISDTDALKYCGSVAITASDYQTSKRLVKEILFLLPMKGTRIYYQIEITTGKIFASANAITISLQYTKLFSSKSAAYFKAARSIQPPTNAPILYYVVPQSETAAYAFWSTVSGATGYELYYSTDGINYTLAVSTSLTFSLVSGLTRRQQTYFKVRAVNGGGGGPYSSVLFCWPVAAHAISHMNNAISGVDPLYFENEEYMIFDIMDETLDSAGINIGAFENFLIMSPTCASYGDKFYTIYDAASDNYWDPTINTVTADGPDFNYDGYATAPNAAGWNGATENNFLMQIYAKNVETANLGGFSNREVFAGIEETGSKYLELSNTNVTSTDYLTATLSEIGEITYDTTAGSYDAYIGMGSGFDIYSGEIFVSKTAGTTNAVGYNGNGFPASIKMCIGASFDGSSFSRLSNYTCTFFCVTGSISTESQRLELYYAVNDFNAYFGR